MAVQVVFYLLFMWQFASMASANNTNGWRTVLGSSLLSSSPKCPHEFHLSAQGDNCERISTLPAEITCPRNFQLCAEGCCRKKAVRPELTCPPEFALEGEICARIQATGSFEECEEGFDRCSSGCCRTVRQSPLAQCPPPYVPCGDEFPSPTKMNGFVRPPPIVQSVTASSTISSTRYFRVLEGGGPQMFGSCCLSEETPPIFTCPDDTTSVLNNDGRHSGTCQRLEETPTILTCPAEFRLNVAEKTCDRVVLTEAEENCPPGYSLLDDLAAVFGGYSDVFESFTRTSDTSRPPPRCFATERVSVKTYCNNDKEGFELMDGHSLDKAHCRRQMKAMARMECPSGFELAGDECIQIKKQKPTPSCSAGFVVERDPRTGRFVCTRVETQKAAFACPTDFELVGDACVRVEAAEANRLCPSGFALLGDKSGCGRKEITKPKSSCPTGFEVVPLLHEESFLCQRQKIVQAKPNQGEMAILRAPMQFTCQKGFALCGDECCREESRKPTSHCPTDFSNAPPPRGVNIKAPCWRVETCEAVLQCPAASSGQRGQCFAVETHPPAAQCPSGYTVDNGGRECRVVEKVPLCTSETNCHSSRAVSSDFTSHDILTHLTNHNLLLSHSSVEKEDATSTGILNGRFKRRVGRF